MLEIFKTIDNRVVQLEAYEDGCWINLSEPTHQELRYLKETFDIESDFIKAAIDPEESAHIESEDDQVLIVVDIPVKGAYHEEESEKAHEKNVDVYYYTVPLAIILLPQCLITVCEETETFLEDFAGGRIKNFFTQYKTRFVLQMMYRNSTKYLHYLRLIEKSSNRIETSMTTSMRNKELLDLMRLEKSLVYLSTSLRANGVLLERLMRNPKINNYPEDEDLLEDVIIENRQAIEMANLYSSILASTTATFASVISNNQNNVMKVFTTLTIVMLVPQLLGSFMGMNVVLPFDEHSPWSFWLITALSIVSCGLMTWWFWRKKML